MSRHKAKNDPHRHKRGPREVSSTLTRYVIAVRGLGAHRKSFITTLEILFFVCGLLLYLVVNGHKWSQMGTKDIKLTIFSIYRHLHTSLVSICTHTFDSYLHTYLLDTYTQYLCFARGCCVRSRFVCCFYGLSFG